MIALTIHDFLDANTACARIAEMLRRRNEVSVPDALCIKYDSRNPEQYISMVEVSSELWDGDIILDCRDPSVIPKAMLRMLDRRAVLIGADSTNIEQFCMVADMFKCQLVLSADRLEDLLDLVRKAESMNVTDVILDPGISDMNQCLEACTDLGRLKEMVPEADHPVMVRAWSGEYALTMSSVAVLDGAKMIVVDDLDYDCCDVLGTLQMSVM